MDRVTIEYLFPPEPEALATVVRITADGDSPIEICVRRGDQDDLSHWEVSGLDTLNQGHWYWTYPEALQAAHRDAFIRFELGQGENLYGHTVADSYADRAMTARSREATAYHEAGHAVACHALGRSFRYVSIVPAADGSLGHVAMTRRKLLDAYGELKADARTRKRVETELIIDYAGGIAEDRFTGKTNVSGTAVDTSHLFALAEQLTGNLEEAEAYLNWSRVRAETLVLNPAHWKMVEALAAALAKEERIPAPRARQVMVSGVRDEIERLRARRAEAAIANAD